MRIDILTLFPNMFTGFLNESIIKRAMEKGIVNINIVDFRTFSKDIHHKVDDTPYGGGGGMVLTCQPLFDCVDSLKTSESKVVLLTPDGHTFNQEMAYLLSKKEKHLILICGHYEGFDERIRSIVDMEISIGDYILTGGELPSMVITDAVVRLLKGAITEKSLQEETFTNNRLDYPTYTKPLIFRGMEVPDVLKSGNHKEIEKYRQQEALKNTKNKRPDLLNK